MLVRIDKEFSDITYVPTSSLADMLSNLCKKHNNVKFDSEESLHLRPYYDYEEQIKQFDLSSLKSQQIQDNPELIKKLQAEMEKRKQKELHDAAQKKKADQEIERQQLQEKRRSVAVDPNAIKSIINNQS